MPPSGLPPDLEPYDALYRKLGAQGWSQPTVDQMEIWTAASYLGEPDREPVIAGSRMLSLRRDGDTDTNTPTGQPPQRRSGSGEYIPPPRHEMPDPETWGRNNPKDADEILRAAGLG